MGVKFLANERGEIMEHVMTKSSLEIDGKPFYNVSEQNYLERKLKNFPTKEKVETGEGMTDLFFCNLTKDLSVLSTDCGLKSREDIQDVLIKIGEIARSKDKDITIVGKAFPLSLSLLHGFPSNSLFIKILMEGGCYYLLLDSVLP